ncbi:MAG: carboxymuconolactone decarboxylase family protein [Alphaproteobacteria bacterium]
MLDVYLGASGALASGTLPAKLREQIALAVAEANGCGYCLSAHSAIGGKLGLGEGEISAARGADSADAKTAAALRFAVGLVRSRGRASDADIEELRRHGFTDGQIGEIVANAALNVFTNYFNMVAGTEVDFPKVMPRMSAAA